MPSSTGCPRPGATKLEDLSLTATRPLPPRPRPEDADDLRRKVIAYNALSARTGGGLSFVLQQLAALERVRPDIKFNILTAPWNDEQISSTVSSPTTQIRVQGLIGRITFEQAVLPLRTLRTGLTYCPGNFCPLGPSSGPVILALQNAYYFGAKRDHAPPSPRLRLETRLCRASIRRATAVIAISRTLAKDLHADMPSSRSKTAVIPGGAPVDAIRSTPPRREPPKRYFLSLANDYPHKRLRILVDAWLEATTAPDFNVSLVLIGNINPDLRRHIETVGPRAGNLIIDVRGQIASRSNIIWFLQNAVALISASTLEAYPLTPGEAGAVGCPAILSDIPAHRETAPPGTVFYNPTATDQLATVLTQAAASPPARLVWHTARTWDDNAHELAQIFDLHLDRAGSGP